MSAEASEAKFGVQGSEFGLQGAERAAPAALVVRIPRGIRSKQKLFAILADKLHFPGYFGWNWDALEECLRDLAWLPEHQPVVIVHDDWPFGAGGKNQGIYLGLLGCLVEHWTSRGEREVTVIPPNPTLDEVTPAANSPR